MTTVQKYMVGPGDVGSYRTISIMRRLVNESLSNPLVVGRAKDIVQFAGPKNQFEQAKEIKNYLMDHTQFVRDPRGVELIHTPEKQIRTIDQRYYIQIDCDDFAVLSAALAKSVGIRAKFVILKFMTKSAPFAHVYTIVDVGKKKWFPIDLKVQYPISSNYISEKKMFDV